jgi:Ni,Fe-hydrogenase III component G
VLTLRVPTAREAASVPSVCGLIPSASVFERELVEMFGITVVGTPDNSRLFLADDWPDGIYPLRKDAVLNQPQKEQAE